MFEWDIVESEPKNQKSDLNQLSAAGWEVVAILAGHKGSEHFPPAVTIYVRRPRAAEEKPPEKAAEKQSPAQRLADARKRRS